MPPDVTLELAGGREDDITIEIHGDGMTIRGQKRNEREQAGEQPCYAERNYGRFEHIGRDLQVKHYTPFGWHPAIALVNEVLEVRRRGSVEAE